MARRTIATVKRPQLHHFTPDPDDPTSCSWADRFRRCGLPERNSVHDEAELAAVDEQLHQQQDEHRRRLGEAS